MLCRIARFFAYRPKQVPFKRWNIITGDEVAVISGKDKGKTGKVFKVKRKYNLVLVSGVNIKTKHNQPSMEAQEGSREQKEFPIHVSNVALIDPETSKPTRISYGFLEDGTKVRISKKSGAMIPKPERPEVKYIQRHSSKRK